MIKHGILIGSIFMVPIPFEMLQSLSLSLHLYIDTHAYVREGF
jgi:hypothetical protein